MLSGLSHTVVDLATVCTCATSSQKPNPFLLSGDFSHCSLKKGRDHTVSVIDFNQINSATINSIIILVNGSWRGEHTAVLWIASILCNIMLLFKPKISRSCRSLVFLLNKHVMTCHRADKCRNIIKVLRL